MTKHDDRLFSAKIIGIASGVRRCVLHAQKRSAQSRKTETMKPEFEIFHMSYDRTMYGRKCEETEEGSFMMTRFKIIITEP